MGNSNDALLEFWWKFLFLVKGSTGERILKSFLEITVSVDCSLPYAPPVFGVD